MIPATPRLGSTRGTRFRESRKINLATPSRILSRSEAARMVAMISSVLILPSFFGPLMT